MLEYKNKVAKLEIYSTRLGLHKEWRCRIKSPNGRILFVSSEGYRRRDSLMKAISYLYDAATYNVVEVEIP